MINLCIKNISPHKPMNMRQEKNMDAAERSLSKEEAKTDKYLPDCTLRPAHDAESSLTLFPHISGQALPLDPLTSSEFLQSHNSTFHFCLADDLSTPAPKTPPT
ncbi:hypothetical protein KFK09_013658 [Dendrobium nobile]|uniref:Uncharacterized protein n=1 Tax=Dendrobium nobile TaxID=94219 RepID=A0A8T3BA99_DENNO|nr:hypothetical protein KFK09_013658 [Dendrobium nobile]